MTDFAEPVRYGMWWPKAADILVFARDAGGNEQQQLYRLGPGDKTPVLLTDAARKNEPAGITHARDRLLVDSTDVDKTGRREDPTTDLALVDPLGSAKPREIATLPGTGWGDYTFSFDDRRLGLIEYKSINESYVWVMDIGTGARRRLLPAEGTTPAKPIASSDLNFARDGKGLFLSTDRDGEFRKLAWLDITSGAIDYFGEGGDWDVEAIALSPDGRTLAVITNEAGIGVLRLYDAATRKPLPRPNMPIGNVRGLVWHENSRDLAVSVNSAQSPSDVYAIDVRDNVVTRWTETRSPDSTRRGSAARRRSNGKASTAARSADSSSARRRSSPASGRSSSTIHGGPEGQARPGFMGRWNYFINELGVAVVEPNVRGSTGYGKTFITLDNGMKREDSVKDIGALLDWIATQPDLDAERVLVERRQLRRLHGARRLDAVRRADRRRDRRGRHRELRDVPREHRELPARSAPRRVRRRARPGDARVPDADLAADQRGEDQGAAVRRAGRERSARAGHRGRADRGGGAQERRPVWYLLRGQRGPRLRAKANVDYLFYAMIEFIETRLLK